MQKSCYWPFRSRFARLHAPANPAREKYYRRLPYGRKATENRLSPWFVLENEQHRLVNNNNFKMNQINVQKNSENPYTIHNLLSPHWF